METTTNTYNIPSHRLDEMTYRLRKVNKKAEKCGVKPATITMGEESAKEVVFCGNSEHLHRKDCKKMVIFQEITVASEIPKLNGWRFLATIQHGTTGNIIRSFSDTDVPREYRTIGLDCDHCHRSRERKDTYLVQHEDNRIVHVGRTCLKDFLGHKDAQAIAEAMQSLWEFMSITENYGDGDGDYSGACIDAITIEEFLHATAHSITSEGWTSGSKAYDYGYMSTASKAWDICCNPKERIKVKYCDDVQPAINWAMTLDGGNDYEHNLFLIAKLGAVTRKTAGYAASTLVAYRKHIEKSTRSRSGKK